MDKTKASAQKPTDKEKEKQVLFKKVVEPRVAKAVKAISLIGNCAGIGYSYTDEQVAKIAIALQFAVDGITAKFAKKVDKRCEFTLDSED